ncbi:MAG: response regulator [Deltaproteobacteria bacterium]|nr:response regulator [Deltaproteobacteria bacterium]
MEKRILLLDDEKDFTELMSTLLGFHDFVVDVFNDPIDIEAAIVKKTYSLIVTDLMMPHMSGFDVVNKLRKMDVYKDVPIIVLSAKTLTDEERKMLLQNRVHYVMKPFEPNVLVSQITQMLGV